MSSCSNCFSGCSDIHPDKCVKYTGADIGSLNISNGDTLFSVEQKLIQYLVSALDGTGVILTIAPLDICPLVDGYLGAGTTLPEILTAIIKAICDLQTQTTTNTSALTVLNADYIVNCLDGVVAADNTHAVVQAIITKLCTLNTSFANLVAALPSTYVTLNTLNTLIQDYLDSISTSSLISNKMIPYVVYPYFAEPGANFSGDGTGLGNWAKVYLCNGLNSTPDLRGRVIVGATNMGGVTTDAPVAPGGDNPTYTLNSTSGANGITLSTAEMPIHTHANSVSATQIAHSHFTAVQGATNIEISAATAIKKDNSVTANYDLRGTEGTANVGLTSSATPAITVTMNNGSIGGNESHNNIQPVRALNYIIYIP